MLASKLDCKKFQISIYERNKAAGRKFLVAGQGGFNLTHSEPIEEIIKKYTPSSFLRQALIDFDNKKLREWLSQIGIETFVGSSGRVFPVKGIKPVVVLDTILQQVKNNSAEINYEYEWQGWKDDKLMFNNAQNEVEVNADLLVLALGGASWPVTGCDGKWIRLFEEKGISIIPFDASNCSFRLKWNQKIPESVIGIPLKNVVFSCGNVSRKGEAVITAEGIEGSGIYPLSPLIRRELKDKGLATVNVDFKPDLSVDEIKNRLSEPALSITERLKIKLKLSPVQIALLKQEVSKEVFLDVEKLSIIIKSFPLKITGTGPIEDAISTVGGVSLDEVREQFELKKMPGVYCIGEMLDWDAPTGGYLLQACFSMGHYLAKYLNKQS